MLIQTLTLTVLQYDRNYDKYKLNNKKKFYLEVSNRI